MPWRHVSLVCCILLFSGASAAGAVIEYPNVTIGAGSYRAFQDTTTSQVWLDLDNLFFTTHTYDSVVALLSGTGYHLASSAELAALQASMPAIPGNFPAEAVIVGANYPGNPNSVGDRSLMWGIYEDGDPTDGVAYMYRYGYDTIWQFCASCVSRTTILRYDNPTSQDLSAWITGSGGVPQIPEPGTLALVSLGLALVAARARRRA